MRIAAIAAPVILALCAGAALASAPAVSIRPEPRPSELGATRSSGPKLVVPGRIVPSPVRPRLRPDVAGAVAAMVAARPSRVVLASSAAAVLLSLRPPARPDNLVRRTTVAASGMRVQPGLPLLRGTRGSVCGDHAIQGEKIPPIPGRIAGCGVEDPVRITSVSGVVLSQAAIMDCTTAQALNAWVVRAVKPAVGRLGGGLAGLRVAAHYACRTRNHQPGARISEHGRGRAIDISAIQLKNGIEISVLKGWGSGEHGRILRTVHAGACGPFGTVLGPESDRFHKDHFHFDTARYRSGPYCK